MCFGLFVDFEIFLSAIRHFGHNHLFGGFASSDFYLFINLFVTPKIHFHLILGEHKFCGVCGGRESVAQRQRKKEESGPCSAGLLQAIQPSTQPNCDSAVFDISLIEFLGAVR